VKPTEHATKTAKATTPLFALLCAPLRGKGSGAGGRALNLLLLALTALALTATPALAGSSHIYSHHLGEGRGEAAGQLELTAPVLFNKKTFDGTPYFDVAGSGVAVNDETHDVYVADTGNRRVDEFEADGTFIRTFGKDVNKTKELSGTGKKEEEEKDVCDPQTEPAVVCQAGAVGSEPGALEAPSFVAVDNDLSSPSHGDVYVGTGVGKEAHNDYQTFEFPGATSGTYTLSFDGETTGSIAYAQDAYNASSDNGPNSQEAQAALEALPSIGKENVRVREQGSTLNGTTGLTQWLEVEFVGTFEETAVAKLGCDPSRLTPAGSACEVEIGTPGAHHVGEIISKFSSDGTLQASWGDTTPAPNGQLTGKDAPAPEGPFRGQLNGIAVDTSGDLWVYTEGYHDPTEYEFGQEGTFIESFERAHETTGSAGGIAVGAPGEIHYAATGYPPGAASGIALDTAENEVYEDFGASIKAAGGSFTSPELEKGGGAGLAVDSSVGTAISSGTVYAANASSDRVEAFGIALGVNPSGPGSATQVTASAATLNGVIDPENLPVVECYFEYGETDEYGQSVPCEQGLGENPGEIGKGTSPVPVSAKLSGLHGGVTYHYRLVARNANGIVEGADETFTTPTVPLVTGGEAANVTEGGAELRADVNPEGLQVSRCTFEYGTSAAYGARETCAQRKSAIGSGTAPVPVSAQISGLSPNTTYYWRLRVEDIDGEAFEPGHTFSYPTTTATSELPDHRAYEMVTPPFKNGASLGVAFSGDYSDIAEDGSRVIAVTIQCFSEARSCTGYRSNNGEPFAFTRTAQGWITGALAPPATQFSENSTWLVGAQEGAALFSMPTGPGGEEEWYARTAGGLSLIGPATPPGSTLQLAPIFHAVKAATADLSHLVFETEEPGDLDLLQEGGSFWPFDQTSRIVGAKSLYEYVGTGNRQPLLVGVEGGEGSTKLIADCGVQLGSGHLNYDTVASALSSDGRTVFFTVCKNGLYARVDGEEPSAHTVMVSAPECAEGQPGAAECKAVSGERRAAKFEGASTDGSRAYFLSTQKLTDEATQGTGTVGEDDCAQNSANACNLYEYDATRPEGQRLVDVSAAENAALVPKGPRVQGVLATSADGSHVYFVAKGVLSAVPNAEGQRAVSGRENLYVYGEGHLAFITVLPLNDVEVDLSERVANVTPDGRFLVFEDSGQVYRYDADPSPGEEAAHVPALVRVTVGQDGYNDNGDGAVGQAVIAPVYLTGNNAGPARGDPTMSNDGSRVFFMSPVGLTPHALNDVVIGYQETEEPVNSGKKVILATNYAENVYEWEQAGHGSCPAGQSSGCTFLISDGHDVSEAPTKCAGFLNSGKSTFSGMCLLGTDATGDNVFFSTTDRLVPKDTDTQEDIYDARVCEPETGNPCITEPPPPLPPCDGESCHGIPPERLPLLTGGSETLNGKGNPTFPPAVVKKLTKRTATCKRGYVKKKIKKKELCVKARGKKRAKKSARTGRRAPR
jgi:hypothetical protein